MPGRMNRLLSNPHVQTKMQEAVQTANEIKATDPTLTSLRTLMNSPHIQEIMEDILDTSRISEPQKKYLRMVFIQKKAKKAAIQAAFGRDLGYQEEAIAEGIMSHPAVKEFIDIIKMFYIQVSPVAALKEIEMILDPRTEDKVRLDAIKDVQAKAGVGGEKEKNFELPVKVVINMPQQTNVQVNTGDKK